MTDCLNCDNDFEGAFCNLCGQKAATHRFTMHEWLHEIPHSVLHVDSGFFLTMKTLFLSPGDAILEYLRGRRKLLFSPFLYVLILCGVFAVIHYLFGKMDFEIKNAAEAMMNVSKKYYKIFIVAAIIPITIASYITYFKSGYNFAEHLVLNCYLIGQMIIADIILVLASATGLVENYSPIYLTLEFILKMPYWFWVLWQFFKPNKWYWGILQFILLQILSSIAITIILTIPITVYLLKIKGSN